MKVPQNFVSNHHLKSDFADAVRNIQCTGHGVNAYEEQYLRLILTHWSCWSAMDPEHMRDSWVQYLQTWFCHIDGLVPILDSLVWPEEVARLPLGCRPVEPSFFVLATPEAYYIFDLLSPIPPRKTASFRLLTYPLIKIRVTTQSIFGSFSWCEMLSQSCL